MEDEPPTLGVLGAEVADLHVTSGGPVLVFVAVLDDQVSVLAWGLL